jgi:hypothetical protein
LNAAHANASALPHRRGSHRIGSAIFDRIPPYVVVTSSRLPALALDGAFDAERALFRK